MAESSRGGGVSQACPYIRNMRLVRVESRMVGELRLAGKGLDRFSMIETLRSLARAFPASEGSITSQIVPAWLDNKAVEAVILSELIRKTDDSITMLYRCGTLRLSCRTKICLAGHARHKP